MYRIVSCVFFAALIIVGEGPASDQSRAAGGTFTGDGVRSVRLLARYGESYPAWLRLRASGDVGGVVSARLDARLLTEMGRYAEADSVLARTALRGEDAFRHHLQRARLNHLAGRLDRACEHLSATDSLEGGSFTAYRDYLAVKIHLEREDVAAARTVGARALQAGVPVPLQDEFEELMVHVYTASGEPSLALEGIRALNSRGRSSQMRARLFHAEYELYSAQGQANEARRVAMEMLTRYPRYEATSAVVDEMLSTVPVGAIQTSDLLSIAVDLQGPDLPRPYHEKAGAEFTTVVDTGTTVTRTFGVLTS
ncbi:MAG: hypothetical protein IH969_02140, partial [Candidatus Krumholzibacteriota bacterium]|nr:hypothetical protein [Candidatus Krumholzibacteriota bacterium]